MGCDDCVDSGGSISSVRRMGRLVRGAGDGNQDKDLMHRLAVGGAGFYASGRVDA